ncbi:MAG: hypothetical protein WAM97_02375 [Acidimicrobiales bacterium]
MPDDRTFVTELATALGMLGYADIEEAVLARPPELRITTGDWGRLEDLVKCENFRAEASFAFENGCAFLDSPEALRGRVPLLIEWTGGRRPPGDEVAPIDLRVDHVFLVSCKYLSANIANPSPARLFDGLLSTSGDWRRGDWYLEVAPDEFRDLYGACRKSAGLDHLPDDPVLLQPDERKLLRRSLPARSFPEEAQGYYRRLCHTVSTVSAKRWADAVEAFGKPEQVLWRLLRIGSAPYYLLGADARGQLRLRIASPWDWRQNFKFLALEITPGTSGQPQVDWIASYETKTDRTVSTVRGRVEVRWSHGKFTHPPEAKIYLETPTGELPGYYPLAEPSDPFATSAFSAQPVQMTLFDDEP